MSLAWHCDRDTCDTWQHPRDDGSIPESWYYVETDDGEHHYCSVNCLLLDMAQLSPLEEL